MKDSGANGPDSGRSDTGDPRTGDPSTGDPSTGDPNAGRPVNGEGNRREGDDGDRRRPRRNAMTPGQVFRLIVATYRTSLPYLLILIAGLLLATWLLTELVF
ncbi:MAG: hypothetical protein WD314_12350 [Trueperaceae bacterium]